MLNEKRFLNDSSIIINIYWSFWQSVKLIVELNFLENLLGYSPTLNSIHRVALLQAGKLLQLLLNQLQEFNQLWPSSNHAKSLLECIIGRILIWCLFCSAQQQTSQPLFIHPVVFINCLRWVTLRKLNQISPPTPCFFFPKCASSSYSMSLGSAHVSCQWGKAGNRWPETTEEGVFGSRQASNRWKVAYASKSLHPASSPVTSCGKILPRLGRIVKRMKSPWSRRGCLRLHFPLIHGDLVRAGLRSAEEYDVLVREGLQGLGLSSLVHRHVFSTHAQPKIVREASLFALRAHKYEIGCDKVDATNDSHECRYLEFNSLRIAIRSLRLLLACVQVSHQGAVYYSHANTDKEEFHNYLKSLRKRIFFLLFSLSMCRCYFHEPRRDVLHGVLAFS